MYLMRFFRWLLGWVSFEAEGGFPERLLNLCARSEVPLWNTGRRGVSLQACCYARHYKKLRPLAKKSGMRLHIGQRHGVPFFLHRYRARAGILAGAAVYAGLLMVLSQRIWVIDVHVQNDAVPTARIEEVLEPMGVYIGAKRDSLDINTIQLKVLEQLPELSWLTVNLNGSIAEVETQVRAPAPEITNKSGPSNLKASCDGTIVEIEVYDGQPMVQKNDAVAEGMLLVSGVVDSKAGPILKRSRARIIAETQHDIVIRLPLEESRLLPNGRVISRPVFQFFGLSIPLYTDGPVEGEYIEEFEKNPLTANGLRLPIGLATQRFILQDMQTITRTHEQAAAEAAQLLEQQTAARTAEGIELVERAVEETIENGDYVLTAHDRCREDICREEPILISENGG